MRLTDAPNKILGKKLNEDRDSIKGIIYLSESESDISFKQPDKMKEVMVSSKVSGDSKGFSVNFYSFFTTSFYNSILSIPLLAIVVGLFRLFRQVHCFIINTI